MTSETIRAALAPCGLSCEKCFAHVDGEIRRQSRRLKEALGNFGPYAERFRSLMGNPVFEHYPAFSELLDFLASENCTGCRNEPCPLFRGCRVRDCHRDRRIDFCYQCEAFPCEETGFDPGLRKVWVRVNERIRKVGVERYLEDTRRHPRYP